MGVAATCIADRVSVLIEEGVKKLVTGPFRSAYEHPRVAGSSQDICRPRQVDNMESKHAAIAPSPRRDTAGLPPPRTNSFMVRALAGPERKFEDHDPAIGTAAVRKVSRVRLPGDVTPVRSVGPDSDSETEDASHKRALLNAFEDRPPKLDPHQFDHVDTNPECDAFAAS